MGEDPGTGEIDEFLRSLGATEEQLDLAHRNCHLAGLAGDLVLAEGATLAAGDLASRAGTDVGTVLAMWRTLGVVVPDDDFAMFSERDAEFTGFLVQMNPIGPHGDELLRVLGGSLSRVAEAAVAVYVQTQEPPLEATGTDIVELAADLAAVTAAALKLGDSMGAVFSHHMRDAIDRQRIAQAGVSERAVHRLAVGFVDLVGFTPLSLHADPAHLLELVNGFESKAFDVAASHHGRIVKHIGDEVMFVALDPRDGCAIAQDITNAFEDGIEPRGGVSFGDVIARHGDYYGTVVNMASRLADLAIPREVLVDADTVRSAGDTCGFRPAGHRLLKGFDDPAEVFSLETVGQRAI
ncbi:MAG: adenylate/guanylate cyclase domain-containing protein [Acidimicrobiales bacterium]